ncbi:assimilatory nitrate reductase electron transfer subunit [Marmoricola sp. OAE513]|uniref:FAD-dependent oxidoreductase n=1 Tax=Marmoricola sp. OAE513 TaxID=2817894 RepID=UPI001AE18538
MTSRQERIVVVGAGMVGHRFVDELVRADRTGRYAVELVGAEEYEPYNRILLSDVLAGRSDLKALSLPLPGTDRVAFWRGLSATAIDREAGEVLLADGSRRTFDRLVLATGARAFVPPIAGLESDPRHVHVLRTLDDCRNVAARAMNAKHAVVLGGGILGLETACGLRRRGVPVTVVDLDGHLMATQLDQGPARAMAGRLRDLGIDVRTRTSVTEVISAYGEVVAVRLTDDTVLAADLVLVSCGVRANTDLAAQAGLVVERGVVVDESLTTDDPRIHAIGDCAQSPDGMTGLLAPGWAQADRLVGELTSVPGSPVRRESAVPLASPTVKLKAAGVDLVTMGVRASAALDDDRVLTVSDPGGRRHVDLVLREGALVGVTCTGAPEVSAALTLAYDRQTPLPVDPLLLLVPEARAEEPTSPVLMPGATTVCRCSNVTKKDIVTAWEGGARTADAVAASTRASTGCGGCKDVVCGLVDWLNASDPNTEEQGVAEAPSVRRSTPVTPRNTPVESTT